jgi:hypothetical protein
MQPQRLCNRIDQCEIWHARRYDIAKVQAYKVPVLNDSLVLSSGDFDEDQEDERDEEEQ